MFEVIKTYTCNGCFATADPATAKAWVHLNNNLKDGTQNMDFCPNCAKILSKTWHSKIDVDQKQETSDDEEIADYEPTTASKPKSRTKSKKADVEKVLDDIESVDANLAIEPDMIDDPTSTLFAEFYRRLYTRVLFDIACDNAILHTVDYISFIPGNVSIDKTCDVTDTRILLHCNGKRLRITRADATKSTAEIRINRGSAILLTRKVSKYSTVQALIEDVQDKTANFLPRDLAYYSATYIADKLSDIDDAIEQGMDLHELREWIRFTAAQCGIEL